MSCGCLATQRFRLDGGNAPSVSRCLPCRAWLLRTSKNLGCTGSPSGGSDRSAQSGVPSQRTKYERTVGLPRSWSADTRCQANSPKLRWLTNLSIQRASGAVTLLGEEPLYWNLNDIAQFTTAF